MISDAEVKERFFNLEASERTFSFTINRTSLYFILRFSIELYFRDPKKPLTDPRFKRFLKRWIRNLNFVLFKKRPPTIIPSELLFVSTSDWTNEVGESVELADIIKYYKSKKQIINFIQPEFTNKKIQRHRYYDSFITVDTKARVRFTAAERDVLRSFLIFLSNSLNRDYQSVYEQYADYAAYILSMAWQLEKLIRRAGARLVFARSIYTEPWILIACKNSGAKCVEVQHGAIHPDSIYYQSYEGKSTSALLFPDYILTIGDEWRNILLGQHNHYMADEIRNVGCREAKDWSHKHHSPFEILICLQHGVFSINDILETFFHRYAGILINEGLIVKLRPHPHAVRETVELYKKFVAPGFEIVNSREVLFYENLKFAGVLISPSSMCLYEAISFGIPAISFEKFRPVTISKGLLYCNSPEQLFKEIMDIRDGNYRQQQIEYLSPFKPDELKKLLLTNQLVA